MGLFFGIITGAVMTLMLEGALVYFLLIRDRRDIDNGIENDDKDA